ncbi:MAG: hypothetical protein K8F91_10465 [Candidatus Obscuribacterales bacterium]|nr:hypothetical protein [Candidatus Obscuribacterales bacterium]
MTNCDVTGTIANRDSKYGAQLDNDDNQVWQDVSGADKIPENEIPENDERLDLDDEDPSEYCSPDGELTESTSAEESEVDIKAEWPTDGEDLKFDPLEASEESMRIYPYDVPRPALTIDEASSILGKSIRSIERSIEGKWGNRLPEGWKARRMKIDGQTEWRIIPPPGFRIRHSTVDKAKARRVETSTAAKSQTRPTSQASQGNKKSDYEPASEYVPSGLGFGFTLEKLIQTASMKAKHELVKVAESALEDNHDHPTIVIDRCDDVERLLRELADTQKELSEERRLHMEDMRLIAKMQDSMRLLEDRSSSTATLKEELILASKALAEHKRQYHEYLALPWWKRMFKKP